MSPAATSTSGTVTGPECVGDAGLSPARLSAAGSDDSGEASAAAEDATAPGVTGFALPQAKTKIDKTNGHSGTI
jgi:hypothetical protein